MAPCFEPFPRSCNSGGPASRTREEHISESLLGKDEGHIRCPLLLRLAIDFDGKWPLAVLQRLLAKVGVAGPEALRSRYAIPDRRLLGRPLPADAPRISAVEAPPESVLEQALLLGLCTRNLYDPARPVLWTEASLTRGIELFDPRGFYA